MKVRARGSFQLRSQPDIPDDQDGDDGDGHHDRPECPALEDALQTLPLQLPAGWSVIGLTKGVEVRPLDMALFGVLWFGHLTARVVGYEPENTRDPGVGASPINRTSLWRPLAECPRAR